MRESMMSVSITAKMYGWSKWGGANFGLVKEELEEWYCQTCGEKQIIGLPSYMIPTDPENRDFVRVCSDCKSKARNRHVKFCWELIRIIKYSV